MSLLALHHELFLVQYAIELVTQYVYACGQSLYKAQFLLLALRAIQFGRKALNNLSIHTEQFDVSYHCIRWNIEVQLFSRIWIGIHGNYTSP